jgi:hypothetical protein
MPNWSIGVSDIPPLSVAHDIRVFRHCKRLDGQVFCVLVGGEDPTAFLRMRVWVRHQPCLNVRLQPAGCNLRKV